MKVCKFALLSTLANVIILPGVIAEISPSPWPFDLPEPNGNVIENIYLKGSAMSSWEQTADGYTVMPNEEGFIVYAKNDGDTGQLSPTEFLVSSHIDPEKLGIPKSIKPETQFASAHVIDEEVYRLSSGTLKNLVLSIRFSDHNNRRLPTTTDVDNLFNSRNPIPGVAPSGSIREMYTVSSYGALNVESTVTSAIQVSNSESYYAAGESGLVGRIHYAITEALGIIDKYDIVDFSQFDLDNNGYIDGFTVLHSGYGAEWGGYDTYGQYYDNRIWSHQSSVPMWTSNDGIKVSSYNISPMIWGIEGSNIGRIGVVSHELGHFLSLPDLYDYNDGNGIGSYGLMGNSWGFDGSQFYPPIMSPWSKEELGWLTPTIIKNSGKYSIRGTLKHKDCFKITYGFSSGEYLLIENRQQDSFDSKMPQGGLVIWHIDQFADNNNDGGYPGQSGWPGNGNHYKVSVLQADGDYLLEKGLNRGDEGDVFHESGRAQLLPSNNPWYGPFPNTDSYTNGNARKTGVIIKNISASGAEMTFEVIIPGSSPVAKPSSTPVATPVATPEFSSVKLKCRNRCAKLELKLGCEYCQQKSCAGCAQCLRCSEECGERKRKWSKKCRWEKCSDCEMCISLASSICDESLCLSSPAPWTEKCKKNVCYSCVECTALASGTSLPSFSPVKQPTVLQSCQEFCGGDKQPWSVKCDWAAHCSGCTECGDVAFQCEKSCEKVGAPWRKKCGSVKCASCPLCHVSAAANVFLPLD